MSIIPIVLIVIMCILLLIGIGTCIVDLYKIYTTSKITEKHSLTKSQRKNLVNELTKTNKTNDTQEED